ncbi:peptidase, M28 family [Ancylostoma caninum]|uniref:Glutaminyl-peptide cyclotransferase n=1 Tax=Ancylostoma caninum TaxID=29170 RepID=A0A368G9E7_ANCCA|nr:peptidase, M28 family [Ancylostoma caninum]
MQTFLLLMISLSMSSLAWGQWRTNQRSHPLSLLPVNSTIRLCRDFMNPARFQKILKPLLVQRIVDTPQHRQVGEYIHNYFVKLGWSTEWDVFEQNTPYGIKTFRTLIVTSDMKSPRRLVLACHYDSKILPGKVMIAATDSAVPCAMMMDIARSLTPYMYRRVAADVALQLIFFDGEEAFVEWTPTDSLYGSRHLAKKWESKWYPTTTGTNFELSREIDRIDVMMLLDLIGARNPGFHNSVGLGANQLFLHLPAIEAELRNLGCIGAVPNVFYPELSYQAVEDDHIPFMTRGIPILHLISVPFPRVWHTDADNEKALHYPTIYHVTSVIRVFVAKYLGIAPL